jgi:hypothetical protein
LVPHGFGGLYRKIRLSLGKVRYVLQSPHKCSCVDSGRKQKKLIGTVSVRVFDVCATKLHISHEPCVRRYRFSMTTKSPTLNISAFVTSCLRKVRSNEVPLCFRSSTSLRAHPNMYHQRYEVSCSPYTVQPWRKSLRKSFVIH